MNPGSLLFHADGRTQVWRKPHEYMHPSWCVSTLQAGGGGVMVWGVFSWDTLCPLIKVEQRLNATGYLNIFANQVHPFMAAMYPSANGFLQQNNSPCHKIRIDQEWFHEHDSEFSLLQWPAQSPDLNPIENLWDEMEQAIQSRDPQPANLTVM